MERGSNDGGASSTSIDTGGLAIGILFITMLTFLGGTFFMTHKQRIPLPYTVVLFLYGIVVGLITQWLWPDIVDTMGSIPPELLFYIFLPVLIFEGSYAINIHALRRVVWQVVILATVGVLINTALLGSAVKLVFNEWSWYAALLLGSLLSATDPVAVVTLLKTLHVEKHITAIVDGEAVMNDGVAIIVFTILLPAARDGKLTSSIWLLIFNCLRLSVLPLIIGPLFGFAQSFWLRRATDGLTKACITVSVTYVSYYVAAHMLQASGVLTLFCQGVFLSYSCPSLFPGVEGSIIYSTWEFLVHLGNTLLFSLLGMILVADVFPTVAPEDLLVILFLYAAMMVVRLVAVESLLPALNMFSFKLEQRHVGLLVHAGLRGGVSATLALVVRQEELKEGIAIMKVTCGTVLLTLLINATSAEYVAGILGFKSTEKYRMTQMQFTMDYLLRTSERSLERVKRDPKYRNANWILVEKYVDRHLVNPYKGVTAIPEAKQEATVEEGGASSSSSWEEAGMINRLLMAAFKNALWHQRADEVISETVVFELANIIATKIDKGELFRVREMQWFHRLGMKDGGVRASTQQVSTVTTAIQSPNHAVSSAVSSSCAVGVHATAARAALQEQQEDMPYAVSIEAEELPLDNSHIVDMEGTTRGGAPPSGDDTDLMVNALMCRLLPTWVVVLERFVFDHGYFSAAHRRAQENAFMTLLAVVKCLTALSPLKYQYVNDPVQARRVQEWLSVQLHDANAAIQFFYNSFPEVTNAVSSTRAVVSIAKDLHDAVEELHDDYGLGSSMQDAVDGMITRMRDSIPKDWDNDAPTKSTDLLTQAVAATTLGKGLRRAEIRAIATMGLERHLREGEIIGLPENAFLIVVFGSLQAIHGRWTTIHEQEYMQSFGDIVGLESMLLPAELRKDNERKWRVISTTATVLLISFNSIKPFLMERSLRSVKALWRAAAVDVVLPFLELIVTPPRHEEANLREQLLSIVMEGTPIIGPQDCARFDWDTQFHLCFYLRGRDDTGLFSRHTPPCYISTFYVSQLVWTDPDVVLYAVPMNISNRGYVPWTTTDDHQDLGGDTPHLGHGSSSCSSNSVSGRYEEEEMLPPLSLGPASGSRTSGRGGGGGGRPPPVAVTHAATTSMLNNILQGIIPADTHSEQLPTSLGATAASVSSSAFAEDSMHLSASPQPPHPVYMLMSSPVTTPRLLSSGGLRYSDSTVCVLQQLDAFVTPLPVINQLLAKYATMLELMCIAAFRYVRYPRDQQNVHHARRTVTTALEFLLGFCMEISLMTRAIELLNSDGDYKEELRALDPSRRGAEIDSHFQSRICSWSRQATITKRYHLKSIVAEMNVYANVRFKAFVAALEVTARCVPEIVNVETVEGLQQLVNSTRSNAAAAAAPVVDS